ncbi:MAG: MBL fold metallo-hydrolase [Planctomycetota bacterium]|nr:MBL fold metallo-hydrolase [Planctomycetota bacterium]
MLIKDPPVAITENLLMLGTAAYPLYLFKGRTEGLLFEGGISAMGPLLGQQLQRLGIASSFIKQVVVTHGHPDHVMAVPLLRQMFPGIKVLASEAAAKTLATEKALAFFQQIDQALCDNLAKDGQITAEHRRPPSADKQIAVDRLLKEGDAIAVDGVSFQVLETRGHSDCSLSFFEPGGRILVISDATGYYLPAHGFWWPNYFTGYATYLDSMRRLAGMGAEVLCLSHNAALRGADEIRAYFRDAIAATEAYHRRIISEAKAGKPVRQIAEQLGSEVYQKTQLLPLDFFQKNCGLLAKLSLRHEGMSVDKQ